jgi:hypothetical protein
MLLKVGGVAAATVVLAMAAPAASACRLPSNHGYLFHRDIPKTLGEKDVVLEVEIDPSRFAGSGPYRLDVKRVTRGDFDGDTVTAVWGRNSCSHLRFAETDSLVVGALTQKNGETVLVARELKLTEAEFERGRP